MPLIRLPRPTDRQKTLACAEFLFDAGEDSKQLEEAGARLREKLGQGWAFPQAVQFLAGKRCARVIESMSDSAPSAPERVTRKALLLDLRLTACRIMAEWGLPPGMKPTEAEIEHAQELFRRVRAILPTAEETAGEAVALPPQRDPN